MIKNYFRILKKTHAHLQTILKTPVKFQRDQTKTVGGVKGTKYLLKTRNHAPRPTENQKQCPSTFLRKGGGHIFFHFAGLYINQFNVVCIVGVYKRGGLFVNYKFGQNACNYFPLPRPPSSEERGNSCRHFVRALLRSPSCRLRWLSWMLVRLETRRSRVRSPPRFATFFHGD